MISSPMIRLPRGRLVPYAADHDEATVRWLNTADIQSTFGFSSTLTIASHRAWLAAASNAAMWAILDEPGSHCGNVLLHISGKHRSAYFQIYLGEPSARGRGLGKSVLEAVLAHAFDDMALHRVWLHTRPDNLQAERLYRRGGFVVEGVERDALLHGAGFISQTRWSILEHEWRESARFVVTP